MDVEERRRQLLRRGAELFTTHSYEELSMARIAREAGVSKALLFHYFGTKRRFFEATLRQAAEELAARTEPDPTQPPLEQLTASLEAFLAWIDDNDTAYRKLMLAGHIEVRELIQQIRDETADRILAGLHPHGPPPPKVRTAARAWLWYMDGVCLDWLEHRDMDRHEARDLLLGTFFGALTAAGFVPTAITEPAS